MEQTISKSRIAHAYVFAGPEGEGKRKVAVRLAQVLLGLNVVPPLAPPKLEGELKLQGDGSNSGFFHPDFLFVSDETGLKIEKIRELIYKLALKPYSAKYKVAVIDAAENMTDEAQNALLKSIEEPKSYTVIILVTSSPDRLKKTILSRAQKINFGTVDFEQYQELLPEKLSEEQKTLIKDFASQKPGLALKIALSEDFLASLTNVQRQLNDFNSSDESKRLLLVNELAESETLELMQALDLWQNRLESELRSEPAKKLAARIALIDEARGLLNQNVNSKLLLTNLMLKADA